MRKSNQSFRYRNSSRLAGYDYRQAGVYFVTVCAHQRAPLFGSIFDGEMMLSALGEVVREEWQYVAKARRNIMLDLYVVMPNHLHGLVIIDRPEKRNKVQSATGQRRKLSPTLEAGSLGAIISQFKAAVSRRANSNQLDFGRRIWQRNYYDHIVRNEKSLNAIRQYIIANPARWREDSLYVE